MYISIEQAIDVYEDLMLSLNKNIAVSIYVYRLLPNMPAYNKEDSELAEKKAAEEFHTLCQIFSKKHSVAVHINEFHYNDWISKVRNEEIRFHDRIMIEVKPKN
jgi:hypothetical protein